MNGRKVRSSCSTETIYQKALLNCQGALLTGSVVRGEAKETSDLEIVIVIFDKRLTSSYRESMFDFGWAIESFVHSLTSYKNFIEMDCKAAMPYMPRMISEGIILEDEGILESIKKEARNILEKGLEICSEEIVSTR